jgi:hypothetical protein
MAGYFLERLSKLVLINNLKMIKPFFNPYPVFTVFTKLFHVSTLPFYN